MWGGSDDAQSIATIRCAVERGIYLIDTAPVYGFGHSDGVVGRALEGLREAGKIRTIGVSNFSPEQMDTFRRAASLATVQPPYNIFERAIERDVLPYAKREKPDGGAWGAEQLNSVHDAFGWKLSSQDLADIDAILTKYVTSPVAPEFMAPPLRDLSGEDEKR
ncbi:aldo/keto reductase [Pandoraea apista]|uniref:aldo/keto reductase n=1 Tax=Pandoraea apista TaxID=93218 RepID=UPI002467F793|nr:aldo/keto reductase [Pandoraea apista]